MANSRLRIYYGPEDSQRAAVAEEPSGPNKVTVPLGDVFPLLAEAIGTQRTWLRDFAEDEITISTDLYEVILAFEHYLGLTQLDECQQSHADTDEDDVLTPSDALCIFQCYLGTPCPDLCP